MPRPRSNRIRGTRYLSEQETAARVALFNAARSTSTEPYDRRKPTVGGVGTPELAAGAVINSKIGEQISNANLPNLGGIDGDLPEGKLPNVPKTKLPNDVQYGRPKAADLDYGAGRPIPSGKVDAGYDYADLKNPPKLGKFLTRNDVKPSALK